MRNLWGYAMSAFVVSGTMMRAARAQQRAADRARYGTQTLTSRGSLPGAHETGITPTPAVVAELGSLSEGLKSQQSSYRDIKGSMRDKLHARSADGLDVTLEPPLSGKDKWRAVVSRGDRVVASGEITADTRVVQHPDGAVTLEKAEDGQNFAGTEGNDILIRMSDRQVNAGAGNDLVFSLGGNGGVDGGDGNDIIMGTVRGTAARGPGGMTLISGGKGDDRIWLDRSTGVLLDGGDGDDTLGGTVAHAQVRAGSGDDTVRGELHFSDIDTGEGDDSLVMDLAAYTQVTAGDGNDKITGNFWRSYVSAGVGDDAFSGRFQASTLFGEEGSDRFAGHYDRGYADGGEGADTFAVSAAHSAEFRGGAGDDIMRSTTSFFTTYDGGDGNDVLEIGRKRQVTESGGLVPGSSSSDVGWKVDGLPGAYYSEGDLVQNEVRGGDGDDTVTVYGAPGDLDGLDEPAWASGGKGRDVVAIYGSMQRLGQRYDEEMEEGEIPVIFMPYV